jgi:hypothetical protein
MLCCCCCCSCCRASCAGAAAPDDGCSAATLSVGGRAASPATCSAAAGGGAEGPAVDGHAPWHKGRPAARCISMSATITDCCCEVGIQVVNRQLTCTAWGLLVQKAPLLRVRLLGITAKQQTCHHVCYIQAHGTPHSPLPVAALHGAVLKVWIKGKAMHGCPLSSPDDHL